MSLRSSERSYLCLLRFRPDVVSARNISSNFRQTLIREIEMILKLEEIEETVKDISHSACQVKS